MIILYLNNVLLVEKTVGSSEVIKGIEVVYTKQNETADFMVVFEETPNGINKGGARFDLSKNQIFCKTALQ